MHLIAFVDIMGWLFRGKRNRSGKMRNGKQSKRRKKEGIRTTLE